MSGTGVVHADRLIGDGPVRVLADRLPLHLPPVTLAVLQGAGDQAGGGVRLCRISPRLTCA